ncbi:chemotaxis protein CheB [Silvibacterium acidisoli]|uniref:chemotaxis protein CheB n=1 Tax=Acidobacteriaceae bacterium ZG23-2 TaxID=2883246 RepID=UPI00406CDDB7
MDKPASPGSLSPTPGSRDDLSESFPIVGMGASAGGLEVFEQFFIKAPVDSGMAFVLVPHLDPTHTSILAAILQRNTTMPVVEAEDEMVLAPNSVYVIPPNREMDITNRTLRLTTPEEPRGHRMPIDHFFRSLAEDQKEQAIGIILSGTGTDGTQGMRAIVGSGGITIAQQPDTAKYSGMPESVIQGGFATHILPVEKMPEVLLAGLRTPVTNGETLPDESKGLTQIISSLRVGTGHDFSHYKKSTVLRRIERRMVQHSIADMQLYARYLKEHPIEIQHLFKELLINVTSFFRDPEAFEALKKDGLSAVLTGKPPEYVFRVWVAGCATGEEAYSIAILLQEYIEEHRAEIKVQIYSTDLDEDAISTARTGFYPLNITEDVSAERLRRFFTKQPEGYQVRKNVRELVVFATQNIIKDPPFTKLDLISCRNLMIYLEPELQASLIPRFHYALKPGGILFLSSSENIGNATDLFTPLSNRWKLYRSSLSSSPSRTPTGGGLSWTVHRGNDDLNEMTTKPKELNIADLAKRMLLQFYAPASVITDAKGNILYVYGETGKYFRPAPGHVSFNAIDMAREGLQLDLRTAIQNAASQGLVTTDREFTIETDGGPRIVSLCVRPISGPDWTENLLLLSFREVQAAVPPTAGEENSPLSAVDQRILGLERDLSRTRENIESIISDQQSSNEELKSANEELQSMNEELQSTNEELETSQEELQSVNEELITVNAELQAKIEQLADVQNDMKNLFDSTNVATIFLDQHLVIRRFTREAVRINRLVASDVGRPLADIRSNLEGDDLLERAENVLETLVPYEREISTITGQWYLAKIQPYRTFDNVIEGVVLTFTDINKRVEAEIAVQEARDLAEAIVDTVRESLVVLDSALKVVSASRSFYQFSSLAPAETIGSSIYELGDRQWDIPQLRELLEKVLPLNQSFENYQVEYKIHGNGVQSVLLNGRPIVGRRGKTQLILLAIEITPSSRK